MEIGGSSQVSSWLRQRDMLQRFVRSYTVTPRGFSLLSRRRCRCGVVKGMRICDVKHLRNTLPQSHNHTLVAASRIAILLLFASFSVLLDMILTFVTVLSLRPGSSLLQPNQDYWNVDSS